MIIWSGWGFMVAVLVFALSLTTELGVEAYFGDDRYYQTQAWPLAAALLVAGGVTWVWGSRLNRVPGRTVIDKQTGREEVIGGPGGIVLLRADAVLGPDPGGGRGGELDPALSDRAERR